jgi:LPS sulfotransferase NodH
LSVLLDPRNGPGWDLPPPDRAVRTWLLAATPRTGSTLLCRMLWDTGLVGAPKEYLNPMQLRDWEVRLGTPLSAARHRLISGRRLALVGPGWSRRRLAAHLERVRQRRSGGGWFGLKLHHHHLDRLTDPIDRCIFLTRRDRVAQAVSWARALQTDQWIGGEPPQPARYSRWLIARCLSRIESGELGWEAYFRRSGVTPLRLCYEELTAAPSATVHAILAHLAVSDTNVCAAVIPTLVQQADAISSAWIARFKSEK